MVDDPDEGSSTPLADAGVSFDGCPAVLNTGHWQTVTSTVRNHTAGTDNFDYSDETQFGSVCCDGHGRYFIEGCEAALDVAGEWSYRNGSNGSNDGSSRSDHILFMPTAGVDLSTTNQMRGKNTSYSFVFSDSTDIEVSGLDFFATTLLMSTRGQKWRKTNK